MKSTIKLFGLLILLASPVSAQEKDFNLFDYIKSLGTTDCEAFLQQGDSYSKIVVQTAVKKDWDAAFYHDEAAFDSYLKAVGYCDLEPENKALAKERLEKNHLLGQWLACTFHVVQAHDASQLSLEHIEDTQQALEHARDSISFVDMAIKLCEYDPEKVARLKKIRVDGVKAITLIEMQMIIEENGH